jgi:ferredoxin-thioredoxin reductase catalytic chain
MAEKNLEQTKVFAQMVASKQAWTLNPDTDFTDSLLEGLTTNFNRYGYYLCPCRDTEGERALDADVICPCKYSWSDIKDFGHCFCALFLDSDFAAQGKVPGGIADRRIS